MKDKAIKAYRTMGLPRLIIFAFFVLVIVLAAAYGISLPPVMGNVLRRWGMFGILVLAMVPGIQCGIGPNFGVSLGIVCGLFGSLLVLEWNMANWAVFAGTGFGPWAAILTAVLISAAIAALVGVGYGFLLNHVKGSEMTVSTYVGFSVIALMNIVWAVFPFKSGDINWPIGGGGARNTISLAASFGEVLNKAGSFSLFGDGQAGMVVPTGLLLFFFLVCAIVYLFMNSKTGKAMSAVGASPAFARASGINVNKMRIVGTAVSTALGAVGIIAYAQAFGFLQMYNAPLMMGFTCVAAVLIGGASTTRARISHVIIGTFLSQGIMVVALPVANRILAGTDLSDIIRLIVSNGIIIYALTKAKGGAGNAE